jgi:hypothetical protein
MNPVNKFSPEELSVYQVSLADDGYPEFAVSFHPALR